MKSKTIYLLLLAATSILSAEEFERVPPVKNTLYQKECGSCHMAYQPQLLPKEAWTRMMDGLDKHFGTDASLPKKQVDTLKGYLEQNSGFTGKKDVLAISKQPWFTREHRGVFSKMISQKEVKSIANCAACHPSSESGDYERTQIPNFGGRHE